MRAVLLIGVSLLSLARCSWAWASAAVTSINLQSGELTIRFSSPVSYTVHRYRYPDQLVITIDKCQAPHGMDLQSIRTPWLESVKADPGANGELRLRLFLNGNHRPEVFGLPPTKQIVVVPGRVESGYTSPSPQVQIQSRPQQTSRSGGPNIQRPQPNYPTPLEANQETPSKPIVSTQPAVAERPTVSSLRYEPKDQNSGLLLIGLTGAVRPRVFYLDTDPNRLRVVVDLPGATVSEQTIPIAAEADGLSEPSHQEGQQLASRIRTGMFQGSARVVLDVNKPVKFSTQLLSYPPQVAVEVTASDVPGAESLQPPPSTTQAIVRPPWLQRQLQGLTIVIDPGHGGSHKGAVGPSGLLEKDVNLDIALRLYNLLTQAGVNAVLTRSSDVTIGPGARPAIANKLGAAVFISIHCNSNPATNRLRGTETYYHMQQPTSRSLAACIQRGVTETAGTKNRGIRSDSIRFPRSGFAALRGAEMPAVLVEVAYINNPEDEKLLADPQFRQRVAEGILNGLRLYVEGQQE
ncbi:MAG: N-acetylmuramoyl-L-alanine amidase [Armatimonadota bacterium]